MDFAASPAQATEHDDDAAAPWAPYVVAHLQVRPPVRPNAVAFSAAAEALFVALGVVPTHRASHSAGVMSSEVHDSPGDMSGDVAGRSATHPTYVEVGAPLVDDKALTRRSHDGAVDGKL